MMTEEMKTKMMEAMVDNTSEFLETSNRRLENFLYVMGIDPVGSYRKWDGYIVWRYPNTETVRQAIMDFHHAPTRRDRLMGT